MPEISYCGRTEAELTQSAVPYEVGMSRYRELARGAIIVFNYPTLSEAYKVAALDATNKFRALDVSTGGL